MKKAIAVALCAALLFTFAACGGSKSIKVSIKGVNYDFIKNVEFDRDTIFEVVDFELTDGKETVNDLLLALEEADKIELEKDEDDIIISINEKGTYNSEDNLVSSYWKLFINDEPFETGSDNGSIAKGLDTKLNEGDKILLKYYTIDLTDSIEEESE